MTTQPDIQLSGVDQEVGPVDAPLRDDPHRRNRFLNGERIASITLPALLVVLIIVFSVLKPATFATGANLRTIALTQSVLAILAIAALFPLVIGAFDVSIGANLGLGAILATGLAAKQGLNPWLAIALAVGVCSFVGLINGLLIAYIKINAFIVTLGMSTIILGCVLWYTGGAVIFENIPQDLLQLGRSDLLGIPFPVIAMVVVAVIVYFVLEHTPFGRYLYAIGGSPEAARMSGLRVSMLTVAVFVTTGFLAGVAGVIQAGQLGSGNPTVGPSFLLPAFAAAFLGATAIKIGKFNVIGTLFAVFLLAVGITGLQQLGVPQFIEPIFNGFALIVGVGLALLTQRRKTSAR